MCHFSDFLDGDRSVDENDRIAQAFLKLNSLLKQPPKLTLDYLVSTLEKTSFLEIILKILLPLAIKLEVEKKYAQLTKESKATNITGEHLGMGSIDTLHGSPDARARGASESPTEIVNAENVEASASGYISDGATINIQEKANLMGVARLAGLERHLSQMIAINVIASFTEKNLHPTLSSMVPVIMLDTRRAVVSVYDPQTDACLVSEDVDLHSFEDSQDEEVQVPGKAILFLWLFINHRIFLAAPPETLPWGTYLAKSTVLQRLEHDSKLHAYRQLRMKYLIWTQKVFKDDDGASSIASTYKYTSKVGDDNWNLEVILKELVQEIEARERSAGTTASPNSQPRRQAKQVKGPAHHSYIALQ